MYRLKVALEMPPYYYVRASEGAVALIVDAARATKYQTEEATEPTAWRVKALYPDAEIITEECNG